MIGGNINYTNSKGKYSGDFPSTTSKGYGMRVSPNLGYFVFDKFAVGVSPSFSFGKVKGSDNNTSYGIGPFVRYYFLPSDKLINVFSHIGYSYGVGYTNGEKRDTGNSFNVKAGSALFFNSSVALEFTAEYFTAKNKEVNYNRSSRSEYFTLGLGFQIHLD